MYLGGGLFQQILHILHFPASVLLYDLLATDRLSPSISHFLLLVSYYFENGSGQTTFSAMKSKPAPVQSSPIILTTNTRVWYRLWQTQRSLVPTCQILVLSEVVQKKGSEYCM